MIKDLIDEIKNEYNVDFSDFDLENSEDVDMMIVGIEDLSQKLEELLEKINDLDEDESKDEEE